MLADVLRSLDVFVVTAAGDATADVTVEVLRAMACGVPCVLADVPALRTPIRERRGAALWIDADDPSGIVEAVAKIRRHADELVG